MVAPESTDKVKPKVAELNMAEWYTGTQFAELLGVSINWLSGTVKYTAGAAILREYAIGKFGPISIFNKVATDAWLASVGGLEKAKVILRKNKTAYFAPRNKEYNDRKKGVGRYVPSAIAAPKKKASYLQVVGEGNADTLAALMQGIASRPVRKYNHKEFGGC